MSFTKHREVLLKDPLSELTRNKRKYLLLSSAVAIAIGKAGFIPTEISALGIKLQQSDQNKLVFFVSCIVLYFLISFLLYAFSDFLAWRLQIIDMRKDNAIHELEKDYDAQINQRTSEHTVTFAPTKETAADLLVKNKAIDKLCTQIDNEKTTKLLLNSTSPVIILKGILDFVVPIAIGIYAII